VNKIAAIDTDLVTARANYAAGNADQRTVRDGGARGALLFLTPGKPQG
jgi:hypothetical protein